MISILGYILVLDYRLWLEVLYKVVLLEGLRIVVLVWRLFLRLLLLQLLEEVELVSYLDRLALGAVLASASAP